MDGPCETNRHWQRPVDRYGALHEARTINPSQRLEVVMTPMPWIGVERRRSTRRVDFGMRLYWVLVTVVSLTLLGATIQVATPRDAADIAQDHAAN
jgi:hypothetical protein